MGLIQIKAQTLDKKYAVHQPKGRALETRTCSHVHINLATGAVGKKRKISKLHILKNQDIRNCKIVSYWAATQVREIAPKIY